MFESSSDSEGSKSWEIIGDSSDDSDWSCIQVDDRRSGVGACGKEIKDFEKETSLNTIPSMASEKWHQYEMTPEEYQLRTNMISGADEQGGVSHEAPGSDKDLYKVAGSGLEPIEVVRLEHQGGATPPDVVAQKEAILANAAARGIGTAVGSTISGLAGQAVVAPVKAAVETAKGVGAVLSDVKEGADAVKSVVGAAKELVATVKGEETKQETKQTDAPPNKRPNVPAGSGHADPSLHTVLTHHSDGQKKRKQESKKKSNTVEIGDHSINMVKVFECAIGEMPLVDREQVGTFFRNYASRPVQHNKLIAMKESGEIGPVSEICRPNTDDMASGVYTRRTFDAYETMVNPPEGAWVDHKILWRGSICTGTITDGDFADYMTGSMPNDRAVSSVLNGRLHIRDQVVMKELSASLNQSMQYWDNSGLYAKLLQNAIVRLHFDRMGVAPVNIAWGQTNWNWQTTTFGPNPVQAWKPLVEAATDHSFVFVEYTDFRIDQKHWEILYLLATGTRRFAMAADLRGPSSRFIEWPAIPITVISERPDPGAPNPMVPQANDLINFAFMLANQRGEMKDLMKGLYIACLVSGIDFPPQPADAAPTRKCYNFAYGAVDVELPCPADYNFLLRLLGLRKKHDTEAQLEFAAWSGLNATDKLYSAAALSGLFQASMTASCNTYNIGRQALQRWAGGIQLNSPLYEAMVTSLNSFGPLGDEAGTSYEDEATIMLTVFMVLEKSADVKIPAHLFPGWRPWGGFDNLDNEAQSLQIYSDFVGRTEHAIRKDTLWAVLPWIKSIPLEWGPSHRGCTFDISREIMLYTDVNQRGWYADAGDKKYEMTANSRNPVVFVSYGWNVLHALQAWKPGNNNWTVKFTRRRWAPGSSHTFVENFVDEDPWEPEWTAAGHLFEPCTLNSFDYDTNFVFAPVVAAGDANNAGILGFHQVGKIDRRTAVIMLDQVDRDYHAVSDLLPDISTLPIMMRLNKNMGRKAVLPGADKDLKKEGKSTEQDD